MNFHLKDDGTGVVEAAGELSIYSAASLRNAILEAFENSNCVEIDFRAVSNLDMSCLQVVYSALETAKYKNKELSFLGGLPEAVEKTVKAAGYPNLDTEHGQARREE